MKALESLQKELGFLPTVMGKAFAFAHVVSVAIMPVLCLYSVQKLVSASNLEILMSQHAVCTAQSQNTNNLA